MMVRVQQPEGVAREPSLQTGPSERDSTIRGIGPAITFLIASAVIATSFAALVLWHLSNQRMPNDDGANYAKVSVELYNSIAQGLSSASAADLYLHRGTRTFLFPQLAVPFLVLGLPFGLALAATLVLCWAVFVLFTYRAAYALSYDRAGSLALAGLIGTLAWVIRFTEMFWSEIAFLAAFATSLFYLIRADLFRSLTGSVLAGVGMGLAFAIRPVESTVYLGLLCVIAVVRGLAAGTLSVRDVVMAAVIASSSGASIGLVGTSMIESWVTALTVVLVVTSVAWACAIRLHVNRRFLAFATTASLLAVGWVLPTAPQALDWLTATSTGSLAQQYVGDGRKGIVDAFVFYYGTLGGWELAVVATLGVLASGRLLVWGRVRAELYVRQSWLGIFAIGAGMLCIVGTAASLGSDIRRGFAPVYLAWLFLAVIWLKAVRRRVLGAAVLIGLGAAQVPLLVASAAPNCAGACSDARDFLSNGWQVVSYPEPFRQDDPDLQVYKTLAATVPDRARIAPMSLWLNAPAHRVFNSYALDLVTSFFHGHYEYSQPTTFDSLAEGYAQLATYDRVLLDFSRQDPNYEILRNLDPYSRLADDLITRFGADSVGDVGWRVESYVTVSDRRLAVLVRKDLVSDANIAASSRGAVAFATSEQSGFPVRNLNDGLNAPWGSAEGTNDVFAWVRLAKPATPHYVYLVAFTPASRAHLRDFSIVGRNSQQDSDPPWQIIPGRTDSSSAYSEKLTVNPIADGSAIVVELAPEMGGNFTDVGMAVLRESRGDRPNWLSVGTGVYLRELLVFE